MPKWEYRHLLTPIGHADEWTQIKGLGSEGWELVGCVPLASEGTSPRRIWIFKRPLKADV